MQPGYRQAIPSVYSLLLPITTSSKMEDRDALIRALYGRRQF